MPQPAAQLQNPALAKRLPADQVRKQQTRRPQHAEERPAGRRYAERFGDTFRIIELIAVGEATDAEIHTRKLMGVDTGL